MTLFNPKAQVIENFFSDDELFEVEKNFREWSDVDIQVESHGVYMSDSTERKSVPARSHYWYPGPSMGNWLNDFCNAKVRERFGQEIQCWNWHILNAFKPYGVHSDSYDELDPEGTKIHEDQDFAWTFLIPLDDYDAHTFVFNEWSDFVKAPSVWAKRTGAQPKYEIDDEMYKKHFTHEKREVIDYFSIDTQFNWKKGNLLAMSRHSFHSSCNFPANGLFEKRALIGWSTTGNVEDTLAHEHIRT